MANIKIGLILLVHTLLILCFTPLSFLNCLTFTAFENFDHFKAHFKTLSNCGKIAELAFIDKLFIIKHHLICFKQIHASSCMYFQQGFSMIYILRRR